MSLPLSRRGYGGFWLRFAATVADTVVLLIPTLLVSFLYRSTHQASSDAEGLMVGLVDTGLNIAIWWIYTAGLLSSSWEATIGKKVCGLKVVAYDGRRIGFAQATGRYFASFLSALILGVGFIMIAWTRRRQALHDLLANTLVVRDV